ncbi:acyloxyacyl hydrolase [Geothermobacter hydrogeniphilus]|uniref:Acyloxyacyl hydrolase n=1 Tax=Geothermobacter hydrogeniphilus TaxID=1969733 RepID=A0A2K2HBI7_9BACT|nr:acyloxyacyl hydrolase [Geothermobacter hydrogeniphilus]PNU20627.1 acyloxyacyl hydrolase [Geothermobacter hydrogeniphilus]
MRILWSLLLALMVGLLWASVVQAGEEPPATPRYAAGVLAGSSYDPHRKIQFAQLNLAALFDDDPVFPHQAPEYLRFKVEANLGLVDWPQLRAMVSGNIFAQAYLGNRSAAGYRPYVEGGIGLIFTDFQVDGQGLRINFNPQFGCGIDRLGADGGWFAGLRLHHISNGHLYHDNRGINSWALVTGRYF